MFAGKVIKGDSAGRELGYPTANLDTPLQKIRLRDGVYAARVICRRRSYEAALVIQTGKKKVEVYLLDFAGGDLYGVDLQVEPIQKVSEIEVLDTDELKEKIAHDIALVKDVFFDTD